MSKGKTLVTTGRTLVVGGWEDLSAKRGNFGYIGKTGKASNILIAKTRHSENPLHLWAVQE